ncbi:MAG: [acyl-carrier-protein] S-malonyltransferase [Candidatus Westeberhardia cardiocondylae]|nr:[acyl-carrier-protein] S-malonyltransferase [Candidatus Westeberhardia cardiocondylae]
MLSNISRVYSEVKNTFNEASSVLGYDLWKLVQEGPAIELNKSWKTQPALLASSVSIWRIWKSIGGKIPKFMAGHSHGEYSALVCSDSLDFLTAIELVEFRGKIMQSAVPKGLGSMSVIIGLDYKIVQNICDSIKNDKKIVELANFNTKNQIVISGHTCAVKDVEISCMQAGATKVLRLPISVPSHCVLMKSAAKEFKKKLKNIIILTPKIPIINNVDVRIEQDSDMIKKALVRQIYNPVRWKDIMQYFLKNNIYTLLEMGPGKVLTKFIQCHNMYNVFTGIAINNYASLMYARNNKIIGEKSDFSK